MKKSQIAIIGRTNVGKSTLFNKLIEKRISIVSDQPNTTRDKIYGKLLWRGFYYNIVDTGGINIEPNKNEQEKEIYKQAMKALDESGVIVFLVDGKTGLLPYDYEIATLLRKYNRKVVLAVNKTEKVSKKEEMNLTSEFLELGFGEPILISAISGRNTGDLLDIITSKIKPDEEIQKEPEIKIAIIGKPNVGKSSLLNSITGEEKSIVSNKAHTTRESIDSYFTYKDKLFRIVDTAGIRKIRKIDSNIEKASISQSLANIRNADVVFFMLDVSEDVASQDKRLIAEILKYQKSLILLVNKWDLVKEKDPNTINQYQEYLNSHFKSVDWAPVMFISAKDKVRVRKTLDLAMEVFENRNRTVDPELLKAAFAAMLNKQKPNLDRKHRILKLRNIEQISTNPPVFSIEIPRKEDIKQGYRNFIENELRKKFKLTGTPIQITTRFPENRAPLK